MSVKPTRAKKMAERLKKQPVMHVPVQEKAKTPQSIEVRESPEKVAKRRAAVERLRSFVDKE